MSEETKTQFDTATNYLLTLIKEQQDKEIHRLDESMEEKFAELKALIEKNHVSTKDHIETVERKINAKLDAVDESFRGNGRIGVFEQLRGIGVKIKILFIIFALLFGLKVADLTLDDWIKQTIHQIMPGDSTTQPSTK